MELKKIHFNNWKKNNLDKNINIKNLKLFENLKKKKSKIIKNIEYYTPRIIPMVEVEKNKDLGEIKLKLPFIEDNDLPKVSIVTPTKNRRFIFPLAIYNFSHYNYPSDKLEWIILNNGEEEIEDILPKDNRIKYFKVESNKFTLGELRNMCIEKCSNDYIVYMDDDDYYHSNSIRARIQALLKYKNAGIECVGCTDIVFFNVMNGENSQGSNNKNYLCEATMAHTKKFWLERKFYNDRFAEFKNFLIYRQNKILNIPYEFIIIALNHDCNTTGLTRFLKKEQDESWKEGNYNKLLFQYFNSEIKEILLNSIRNRKLIK